MAQFMLMYRGGQLPSGEEAREMAAVAWNAWFARLGDAVLDKGNPFGDSRAVLAGGETSSTDSHLTGYSVLDLASLDAAVQAAQNCPVLMNGSIVEVYSVIPR